MRQRDKLKESESERDRERMEVGFKEIKRGG